MNSLSPGAGPSRRDVADLLEQVEGLYQLGGPETHEGLGPMEPDSWHGSVLAELDDAANMDPDVWAETARWARLDNAAGVRALVRLSAASAVAAALRYALGEVEAATGRPVAPETVLDEIAVTHWWLESQSGAADGPARQAEEAAGLSEEAGTGALSGGLAAVPDGSSGTDRARRLRRCPNRRPHLDGMDDVDWLHRSGGDDPGWTGRGRAETARLLEELDRRRCAGGPLFVRPDGQLGRADPDDFLDQALVGLGEDDGEADWAGLSLPQALRAMEVDSVESLRSFRRLVAVRAAVAAVRWGCVPQARADAALQDVLDEVDGGRA